MHVVLASSEAVPFCKTGGLADVCGALPLELTRLGVQTTLFLPYYSAVADTGTVVEPTGITLQIPLASKLVSARILLGHLAPADNSAGNEVPVYFIDQPDYFHRPGIYQENGGDYADNCERFVFFSRAVMEAIRQLSLRVDILHCNDWQTSLIPALLKIEYGVLPGFENATSLLTVHNLAYQGSFWHWDMLLTGLDWKYFNWTQMECHGKLNLLKTGLVFADAINTVSPTYAREIQTPALGCGLEGVLQNRREVLSGILNGIDTDQWNPAADPLLAKNYDIASARNGKAANKAALQQELGLPVVGDVPLIVSVGRLAEQKGFDLILDVLRDWLPTTTQKAQWAFLGTGDPAIQDQLAKLAERHPDKLAVKFEFSDPLAHRMEAASDMFVMPSRFEPCGLSQLYSLRYGTVPIVRATGGLVDTITDVNSTTLANGTATGFAFEEYHPMALAEALKRALELYADASAWQKLVETGMRQDWSWNRSAREYMNLYERMQTRSRKMLVGR